MWMEQIMCRVTNGSRITGYLAIDSTINNRSCGGLRLHNGVNEEEVSGLARAMTLKYGFLGLPQGGAKAGVVGDPESSREERLEQLVDFARSIAPLLRQGIFLPAADMGTTNEDIRFMLQAIGIPVKYRELKGSMSGYYTARSVFSSIIRAISFMNIDPCGATAAIEGFGKVGLPLAQLLSELGMKIVAISTQLGALFNPNGLDIPNLISAARRSGSRVVNEYHEADQLKREELFNIPCDVLCPCARHHSLNEETAPSIETKLICAGANNPATQKAENIFQQRDILLLPDFVTNSGGVLGGTMEFASLPRKTIELFIDNEFGNRVEWLLESWTGNSLSLRDRAMRLALNRMQQQQKEAEKRSPLSHLFSGGLELYRRGWIPARLMTELSPAYFRRRLPGKQLFF